MPAVADLPPEGLPPSNDADLSIEHVQERVPGAVMWMTAVRIVVRVLAVGTTLVLARLIPPEQYGVFASVLIVSTGLSAFTEVGVHTALLQMRHDPRPYLNTAWSVDVARAVVLYLVVFVTAPWWADFFHVGGAIDLLRVLAAGQLIAGFQSIGVPMAVRQLQFQKMFALQTAEAVAYSVAVLVSALLLRNAWALVIGTLAGFAVRTTASYVFMGVRARLAFDHERFVEMFRISQWVNSYTGLTFLLETADNAVMARVVGTTSLALYRMGYQLATEGSMAVQFAVTSVAMPAIAHIQFQREHVRQSFRGLFGFVAAVLVPATIGLTHLGPVVVPLLLGDRWELATQPLQILAWAALVRAILDLASPVLQALGHMRGDFVLKLTQAVIMLVLLYPAGVLFGMQGVATAVLVAAVATLPMWVWIVGKSAHLTLQDFAMPPLAPILAGAGTLLVLLLLPRPQVSWQDLVVQGAVLVALYVGLSAVLLRLLPASGLAAARQATQ